MGAGGIEAVVCGLSNELAKSNEVSVCTINRPHESDLFYNRLDPRVGKGTIGKTEKDNPLKIIFRIYRYIRRGEYDIIHVHGFFYYYSLAILLLHKRTTFLYTIHSDARMENNPWDQRILFLKRWCFKKGWIHPVTISPASQDSFSNLYGCDSRLICNGIPLPKLDQDNRLAAFGFSPSTKVFIHPGRISAEKNQEMLCRIFEKLIREGHDIALLIAGPIHFQDIFERMSGYFSERIRYIGERKDIPQLMSHCQGMCLCSKYEGLPIVLLEALSVGCIPICTPVGGILNVVHDGKNGILATEVSEDSYQQAMRRLLEMDEEDCREMREKARESFAPFDIRSTAVQYADYYKQLLDR